MYDTCMVHKCGRGVFPDPLWPCTDNVYTDNAYTYNEYAYNEYTCNEYTYNVYAYTN